MHPISFPSTLDLDIASCTGSELTGRVQWQATWKDVRTLMMHNDAIQSNVHLVSGDKSTAMQIWTT